MIELATNQSRERNTFVYQWFTHGFFSEFDFMLVAILYCMMTGKQFALSSTYSPHFGPGGWTTFFEPFCASVESSLLHFLDDRSWDGPGRLPAVLAHARKSVLLHLAKPLLYPRFESVVEHWDALRALSQQGTVELAIAGRPGPVSLRDALHAIHADVWRFNADTRSQIDATIASLDLPERYGALHIRRGDKAIDMLHCAEERYIERIEQVSALTDVYVFTDDYDCIDTVRRLRPHWRVWSLCPQHMHGYVHRQFIRRPRQEIAEATLRLLSETEILKAADVFVGTFSSGPGEYQGIARANHTYGVDYDEWLIT